jgi:hypothetical protein
VTIDIFSRRFVACCIEDAKTFCRSFFDWYNQDHHHAGIGLMTPDEVPYGQAGEVHAARQKTLDLRLTIQSRTRRQKAARTAAQTERRLDQPANPKAANPSLNSNTACSQNR